MTIDKGAVSYSPNSLRNNSPQPASDTEHGYTHHAEKVEGQKIRKRNVSFDDHYRQATLFWNSMSPAEKQHIIKAFHFEVGSVKDKQLKQRVVDTFNNVDGQLAAEIAKGIGVNPPQVPGGTGVTASSPAVSQENTIKSARTRKVAILIENGFNFNDVTQVMTALSGAGIHADIISMNLGMITSAEGQQLEANKSYANSGSIMYDALYLAGGKQSVDSLMMHKDAKDFINDAFVHAKPIGATNESVDLLMSTDVQRIAIAGVDTQGQVFYDLGIVTVRNTSDLTAFNLEFINALAAHRHWMRQNQDGKLSG
jgi:catalase